MNFPVRNLLAVAALCGAAACGYKGPLYHPDAGRQAVEAPAEQDRADPASSQDDSERTRRNAPATGPT